jgi:hypothetical protein
LATGGAVIASKLAPTREWGESERDWSAGGPPSLAGQLPQGSVCTCKRLVGWRAAIAGRPAPTGFGVHLQEIGRLAGRHRWQASSHTVRCAPARDWSAGGPPSLAGQLPQGSVCTCKRFVGFQAAIAAMRRPDRPAPTIDRRTRFAPHHSTGRAVARLQLLILIHPPLRQAEWRRSSRGQARSAVRRSRTHREEVVAKQTGGDAPR